MREALQKYELKCQVKNEMVSCHCIKPLSKITIDHFRPLLVDHTLSRRD